MISCLGFRLSGEHSYLIIQLASLATVLLTALFCLREFQKSKESKGILLFAVSAMFYAIQDSLSILAIFLDPNTPIAQSSYTLFSELSYSISITLLVLGTFKELSKKLDNFISFNLLLMTATIFLYFSLYEAVIPHLSTTNAGITTFILLNRVYFLTLLAGNFGLCIVHIMRGLTPANSLTFTGFLLTGVADLSIRTMNHRQQSLHLMSPLIIKFLGLSLVLIMLFIYRVPQFTQGVHFNPQPSIRFQRSNLSFIILVILLFIDQKLDIRTLHNGSIIAQISYLCLIFISIHLVSDISEKAFANQITDEILFLQQGHDAKPRTNKPYTEIDAIFSEFRKIKSITSENIEKEAELKRLKAIAQTTQTLAHDVRKPFSMISSVLTSLKESQSPSEMRDIIALAHDDVNEAITTVSSLLQDIMEVGNESEIKTDYFSLALLINDAIKTTFLSQKRSEITLLYDYRHQHLIRVDAAKITRALSNIIENALHAMNFMGNIWFKTRERGGKIELKIGNNNSKIDPNDLEKIFEPFFTKNKKGGTGLGLAIVKKTLIAHGCNISAHYSEKQGTEFILTLPKSALKDERMPDLYNSSQQIYNKLRLVEKTDRPEDLANSELIIESQIKPLISKRIYKLLILDDELIYCNNLESLMKSSRELAKHIQLITASNSAEVLDIIEKETVDFGILDFDLGPKSWNGIEVLGRIIETNPHFKACLHSNRMTHSHQKLALDAGAISYLPKPMSKIHLLSFLKECLEPNS